MYGHLTVAAQLIAIYREVFDVICIYTMNEKLSLYNAAVYTVADAFIWQSH